MGFFVKLPLSLPLIPVFDKTQPNCQWVSKGNRHFAQGISILKIAVFPVIPVHCHRTTKTLMAGYIGHMHMNIYIYANEVYFL